MSENKTEEMLYSQTQIASNLKISQSTVTRLLKKNGLRPVKIKGNERLEESHKLQLGLEQKLKILGNARDKRCLNYHSGTLDQYFFRVMILPTCGE